MGLQSVEGESRPGTHGVNRLDPTSTDPSSASRPQPVSGGAGAAARLAALLVESVPTGLVVLDRDGRLQYANRSFRRTFELGDSDLAEWHLEDLLPSLEVGRRLAEALEPGAGPGTFLVEHTSGGESRILRGSLSRSDESHGTGRLLLLLEDLTEEIRLAETAVAARERMEREHAVLEALLDHMADGVAACDAQGSLTYFNRAARALHGGPAADLAPETWTRQYGYLRADGTTPLPWEEHPLFEALTSGGVSDREICLPGENGDLRVLRVSGRRMASAYGEVFGAVIVLRDITEQRRSEEMQGRLESQLRQAQKLEAIGGLAGGVAHDFNNILTAIIGYSDLLLERLPAGDGMGREVSEILKAAERGARLTHQLLVFSRRQVMEPRLVDLNEIVEGILDMLRRLIGEHIELVTRLDADLGSCYVDPGKLEQVIMNLVVNARDAMPGGGRVTVTTDRLILDDEFCLMHPGLKPGPYAVLSVGDTGTGMTPEVQARIFEPFFTTKEKGRGTGLGLATVYGIVKQSGGAVIVESEPGRGTRFRIPLPEASRQVTVPEGAKAQPRGPGRGRGRETILLVEDEEVVRSLVSEVLRAHGYEVLEAADGEEALERVRQREGPLHLVVTDLVMPRVSGGELARTLRRDHAGLKVLLVSGYSDREVDPESLAGPGSAFLQKPFSPADLTRKVRELLDLA
jgi:signal transduction histidine kinase/CheY-like chemotaxis protein